MNSREELRNPSNGRQGSEPSDAETLALLRSRISGKFIDTILAGEDSEMFCPKRWTCAHSLIDKLLSSQGGVKSERKQVTIMFADLSGFTALSERMDPEEVTQIINKCFGIVATIIYRYKGTIDQRVGDCVLALFGAPVTHEDDPERAVRAALEILDSMSELRRISAFPLEMHIGINSGLVVTGHFVSGLSVQYTVVGDAVNVASRIQGKAKPGQILVEEGVYHLTQEAFEFRKRGELTVKGKSRPIKVYEPLRARPKLTRFERGRQRGLTPFIGRAEELSALRAAFEKVMNGRGHAVGIRGEAGVGKSRLLHQFHHTLGREVLYLQTHCLPYGELAPYQPLIGILRQYWHLPDEIDEKSRVRVAQQLSGFKEHLPCFEDLLCWPVNDPTYAELAPHMRRKKIFEALFAFFAQAAAKQPLVITLEDLQWADQTSQDFIAAFLDLLESCRILLILVSRPELVCPWEKHPSYTSVLVRLLAKTDNDSLVKALFDGPVADELCDFIVQHAEGSPFFAEELVRSLCETRAVQRNGHYSLTAPFDALNVPKTVQGILAARIDRLDQEAKGTLQVAGVIGQEFPVPVLQHVQNLNAKLEDQLEYLANAEFIHQQFPVEQIYAFKHAFTRDVAYDMLLREVRRKLHQRVADALKDLRPSVVLTEPEVLARHYTEAALPSEALPYWLRAAQKAIDRSANAEAIRHLTNGLQLIATQPDTPERAQQELPFQLTLGAALIAASGFANPEVGATFRRALELCRHVRDTPLLFRSLRGIYVFYLVRGDMRALEEIGAQLLNVAEQSQDSSLVLEAHHAVGITSFHTARFPAARQHLEQALAVYDVERHRSHRSTYGFDPAVSCLVYEFGALCYLGYPDDALRKMRECIALAQQLGQPMSVAYANMGASELYQHLKLPNETRQWAEATLAIASQYGFPHWLAWGSALRGWAVAMQGNAAEGIAEIRQGIGIHQSIGSRISLPTEYGFLAEACLQGSRIEEGLSAVEAGLAEVKNRGEAWWSAELHRLKGELLLAASPKDCAKAQQSLVESIAVARQQVAKYFELQATLSYSRLLQKQNRIAEARSALAGIYGWFTQGRDAVLLKNAKDFLQELS